MTTPLSGPAAHRANQPETELPTYGDFFRTEAGFHLPDAPEHSQYREPSIRRGQPMSTGASSSPFIFDPAIAANPYCHRPCYIPGHVHDDGDTDGEPFRPLKIKRVVGPHEAREEWFIDG